MLTARQKAALDLYYRILNGEISADDITGTVGESNLPASVTGDIGTGRIQDGAVTMAKLGGDVSMVKAIYRGAISIAGGPADVNFPADNDADNVYAVVNPAKAFSIVESDSSIMASKINADGTLTIRKLWNDTPKTAYWQVIEFL